MLLCCCFLCSRNKSRETQESIVIGGDSVFPWEYLSLVTETFSLSNLCTADAVNKPPSSRLHSCQCCFVGLCFVYFPKKDNCKNVWMGTDKSFRKC